MKMINLFIAIIDTSPLPRVGADGGTPIKSILQIVFAVIGALSLFFITFGGFKYVISRGDPQAIAKAKDTILYAIVGLIITLLASAIVNFTLGKI